jgi:cytochrome c5
MKNIAAYTLGVLFLALSFSPTHSAEKTEVDGKTLFEKKCSICHSLDRSKSKKKTMNEWKTTVMRMMNVRGAPGTEEEAKIIIDYLAKNYGK